MAVTSRVVETPKGSLCYIEDEFLLVKRQYMVRGHWLLNLDVLIIL